MSERKALSGGDWLGIGVFFVGTAIAVLMTYGLSTGVGGTTGTAAVGAGIAAAIGPWPALLAGVGIAFLGARAFLTGARRRLGAEILGVLGIAAGLSVIAGSLGPDAGGALGAWTGGRVAEIAHVAVGVLLGAIVAFGAAYMVWMREDTAAATRLAPPRRATTAPPKTDDGVTIAESAMLFPVEDELAPPQPIAAAAPARLLYPEDVRLKGQVPSGAKPLADARPSMPPAEPTPSVYRWTAPGAAVPVARVAAGVARAAAPVPLAVEAARMETAAIETAEEFEADPPVARQVGLVEEDVDEAEARALPPRPSWETTGLTEEDEPVDAYGTPVSFVERARRDRDAPETTPARHTAIPRELDAPEDDEEPVEIVASTYADDVIEAGMETTPVVEDRTLPLEDELASTLDAEMDALEELAVSEERASLAETVDTEAEEDEEILEEAMSIEGPDASTAPAELQPYLSQQDEILEELRARNTAARVLRDSRDEAVAIAPAEAEEILDEDGFADADSELEIVAAGDDDLDGELDEDVADETDEVDLDVVERAPEPRRPELAHAGQHATIDTEGRAARTRPLAPSLFDALDDGAEEEPAQREVVLQPQAAMPAARAEKSPGRGIDPEKKLLVEVGCMFVERGRVAVSMLQRQYDMDFEQACRVLDDLQEMGLIGPYLGGKHREILLTKEGWLEKVGAA